jgi:hypothetical protein
MTAPTPEQMRALADERGVVVQHWGETKRWATDAEAALRAAADQLEAVRGLLQTLDPGNPYMYDPWSDESVDPTNIDEVVRAAVSAGWSKGAHELARSIRESVEGGTSHD